MILEYESIHFNVQVYRRHGVRGIKGFLLIQNVLESENLSETMVYPEFLHAEIYRNKLLIIEICHDIKMHSHAVNIMLLYRWDNQLSIMD